MNVIGAQAFSFKQLTSLSIPNSITSIGEYAFKSNLLTNLVIPSSVTYIGRVAFDSNNLPDNQALIYARTASGLENTTSLIGYGGANKSPVIPNNVTSIGDSAFYNLNLTGITIPNSVTIILGQAFQYNQLTSITIPSSVTSIGAAAFTYQFGVATGSVAFGTAGQKTSYYNATYFDMARFATATP